MKKQPLALAFAATLAACSGSESMTADDAATQSGSAADSVESPATAEYTEEWHELETTVPGPSTERAELEGVADDELAAEFAERELSLESVEKAVNDDFEARTIDSDHCGVANFVDYGPGAPGGGNNDDYIVIHDYCEDGHGVLAKVWIDDIRWGTKYNGNGLKGAAVVWDPFKSYRADGNVLAGETVVVEVCLVDGPDDMVPSYCGWSRKVIKDG